MQSTEKPCDPAEATTERRTVLFPTPPWPRRNEEPPAPFPPGLVEDPEDLLGDLRASEERVPRGSPDPDPGSDARLERGPRWVEKRSYADPRVPAAAPSASPTAAAIWWPSSSNGLGVRRIELAETGRARLGVRLAGPREIAGLEPEPGEAVVRLRRLGREAELLRLGEGRHVGLLGLLPLALLLADQPGVREDLLEPEDVLGALEQTLGVLVVPFGLLDLAEPEPELDPHRQPPGDPPRLVGPLRVLAALRRGSRGRPMDASGRPGSPD